MTPPAHMVALALHSTRKIGKTHKFSLLWPLDVVLCVI